MCHAGWWFFKPQLFKMNICRVQSSYTRPSLCCTTDVEGKNMERSVSFSHSQQLQHDLYSESQIDFDNGFQRLQRLQCKNAKEYQFNIKKFRRLITLFHYLTLKLGNLVIFFKKIFAVFFILPDVLLYKVSSHACQLNPVIISEQIT